MSFFCWHNYEPFKVDCLLEIKDKYDKISLVDPENVPQQYGFAPMYPQRKLVSIIFYKCSYCSKVKTKQVNGRVTLNEILSRSKKYPNSHCKTCSQLEQCIKRKVI